MAGAEVDTGAAEQHRPVQRRRVPPRRTSRELHADAGAEAIAAPAASAHHQCHHRQRNLQPSPSTTSARNRFRTTPPMPPTSSTPITIPGCSTPGQSVCRPAQGRLRGESRRDLRPGQHQVPGRRARALGVNAPQLRAQLLADYNVTSLALEIAGLLPRPAAAIRSSAAGPPRACGRPTCSIPCRRAPTAWPASARCRNSPTRCRSGRGRLDAGVAPGHAAGQRAGHRAAGQGSLQLHPSPKDDGQFADYVTNPSLPVLLQTLFGTAGVRAPNVYPRTDLVAAFLTGVKRAESARARVRPRRSCASTPAPRRHRSPRRMTSACWAGTWADFPMAGARSMTWWTSNCGSPWAYCFRPSMAARRIRTRPRTLHVSCITPTVPSPIAGDYLPVFPYLNTPVAGSPTSAND